MFEIKIYYRIKFSKKLTFKNNIFFNKFFVYEKKYNIKGF